MRSTCLRFTLLCGLLSILPTRVSAIDVYLVAGQSNGWRISHLKQANANPSAEANAEKTTRRVHYFGMNCVSEPAEPTIVSLITQLDERTMGQGLADSLLTLSNDDIVFVQYCRCGAGLWNKDVNGWYPGDDPAHGKTHDTALYGLLTRYLAHCQKVIEVDRGLQWNLRGLLWHQGESDSNRPIDDYERDFRNLVWRFRHDLGETLPIVAGHIRELDEGDKRVNGMFDRLAREDRYFASVVTRDLTFAPDRDGVLDVHIGLEGCHELGRRMAKALHGIELANAQQSDTNDSATVEHSKSQQPDIRFQDVTVVAGLKTPLQGLMGHGGAWGDVDNDGDLDLYVGGFADRPDGEYAPAEGPVGSRLFLNHNGTFTPAETPSTLYARTSGAIFADFDNDGTLELYVANNAKPGGKPDNRGDRQQLAKPQRSVFYHNVNGKLVDISASSLACPEDLHTARNIGVFDYDRDGLLDLLLIEDRFRKNPRSVLLKNEGGLKFRDVTREAGLPDDLHGLGLAVADLNNDGSPDFFIGHSNRLFLSRGDGTYSEPESLKQLFSWTPLHGEDWPCGAAFGDLNGDGLLDMALSLHCETARNRLYINRGLREGIPQFEEVTTRAGWPDSISAKCPHVEIQDFDNDGHPDVYFSAGWLNDQDQFQPLIARNLGPDKEGIPQFSFSGALDQPMVYYPAGPAADVNGDGKMDLFLINWFSGNYSRLLQNVSDGGNWVDVAVTGRSFNRMGIGSRVELFATDGDHKRIGTQEIQIGSGYASGGPAVAHFGTGTVDRVDVQVRLPNGKTLSRTNVPVNQRIVFEE